MDRLVFRFKNSGCWRLLPLSSSPPSTADSSENWGDGTETDDSDSDDTDSDKDDSDKDDSDDNDNDDSDCERNNTVSGTFFR